MRSRSLRIPRAAWPLAGALSLAFACGTSKPRELGDDGTIVPPRGDAGLVFGSDASSKPPSCGVGPDGGVCDCLDVPLLTDIPNLYFVIDRSGSMNDGGKWDTVRSVIAKAVLKLGPRINVGVALLPDPKLNNCAAGVQVMPVRPGDPAGVYGTTNRLLVAAVSYDAFGGTPTAATLDSLRPMLTSLPGRTFVILATDGGPNCNAGITCGIDACIPNIEHAAASCVPNAAPNCCDPGAFGPENCLDGAATVKAVSSLKSANIPLYVIGVPGSGPYAAVLDQMAQAGGTARASSPLYYRVDSTDTAAFASALSEVAAKITASCTLQLKQPPINSQLVNVYLDEAVVPKDPVDGWDIQGATVTLLGAACKRVLTGAVLDVRIIAGCPTVLR